MLTTMLVISFPTFQMLSKMLLQYSFLPEQIHQILYIYTVYMHFIFVYFLSLLAISYVQLTLGQCQDKGLQPSTNLKIYV